MITITTLLSTLIMTSVLFAGEPINTVCPFTGNPVNSEVTTTVGEVDVAFCCGGCKGGFEKWDNEKQMSYINGLKSEKKIADAKSVVLVHTPYLLDICPISGSKLDSKDKAITEIIDGREIRFCCAGCVPYFNKDKEAKFKEIDAKMIAQQLPFYPIDTCIVSGEPLDKKGGSADFIYGNRLFRTCCNDCKAEFLADPVNYVAELDEEIIKLQKKSYPITTCVVGKGPLDGMGGPDYMIVGNRLVQLCCAGCRPKVLSDPLGAFALIDEASKE
ncbi:MAG: hypothetical protein OR996_05625 [Phycisphaerales bacterium]|nr:hypothetical protein [Phycisphaerales bacterium]